MQRPPLNNLPGLGEGKPYKGPALDPGGVSLEAAGLLPVLPGPTPPATAQPAPEVVPDEPEGWEAERARRRASRERDTFRPTG